MTRRASKDRPVHKPETAGRLAVPSVATASADETVAEVRRGLQRARFEVVDMVAVLDGDGRYRGAADMRDLLIAPDDTAMSAIISAEWPAVAPETDQEHAAAAATAARVAALPVVDRDGRLIGCIPATTLLDVLGREHREDLHRIAGILREREGAIHALEDPLLVRVSRRLPWLLVGLVLSAAAAGIMAGFEATLRANLAVAFFIPSLVYLTDAIGTQTEAIAVRGLAVRRRPLRRLLVGEALTGGAIGLILGVLAVLGIWAVFGDLRIAVSVGIALFLAGMLASSIGLVLPWTLARWGLDPAFGSGPVATIIQDVLTIAVYFFISATLIG